MTVLYFIIALGILVLVHEWGHFFIARRCGIRVEQFSIGFGPKIIGFNQGGTEFKISPIPLGGYVKLYGEDPVAEADGNEDKAKEIAASPDAFSSRPWLARLATVLAGPIMNLVLCLLLMPIVFMLGRQIPAILEKQPQILGIKAESPAEKAGLKKGDLILTMDDISMADWGGVVNWILLHPDDPVKIKVKRDDKELLVDLHTMQSPFTQQTMGYVGFEPQFFWGNDPVVGTVNANGPAFKAGLKEGDVVVSINEKVITTWDEMTEMIRSNGGKEVTLAYRRDDKVASVKLVPEYNPEAKAAIIGITRKFDESLMAHKKYPFKEALSESWKEVSKLFGMTVEVLVRLFKFELSYKALGGPLQIAQATGAAAKSGLSDFLYFMAFLSMQLGVLNLLPIPVLDGGHVLFMSIELIRRKPLSFKLRNALVTGGMILLLGLMLLITVNDVDRIWGFADMWNKITGFFE